MLDPVDACRVRDHYFSLLRYCKQPNVLHAFIQRWIDLLNMYSSQNHFVTFEPKLPLLKRLKSGAVAVLVVPFENTIVPARLKNVSIFPLYPFRVRTTLHTECSRDGEEMLQLYLTLSRITLVGFYKVSDNALCVSNLLLQQPHLRVYTNRLFSSFCQKCHMEVSASSSSRL